ncbi:LPXTG cell wall anchor domain-containing protein [uncultured Methanospirillum sp.]|uniref:COG1361 S-layer family protein n=1 Tax=uncultured Methanospirillum sp. TaxID=262503 RepID=UPI0029C73EEE|nr:LPXTG cell wall anchor domain-containing protein [uncultured Methanospirillum sp.]
MTLMSEQIPDSGRYLYKTRGGFIRTRPASVIICLLFLSLFCGFCSASEPTIVITGYQVQPEVIMPGGSALITATVTNTAKAASMTTKSGTDPAESVTETKEINAYIDDVELFGNGLEVISGDYRRVGEVGPGQSIPLTFLVKAPQKTGIYFPELHIATQGGRSLKYPIPVNINDDRLVQKNPAIIVLKNIPDHVIPGDEMTGTLVLKNTGETAASEVILNVSSESREVSFTSPGSIHIGRLGPGDEVPVDFSILTSREVTEGIHPVQCHIRFNTASGRIIEQNEEIPVRVTGEHELSISSVSTDPGRVTEGNQFTLIVRIENTGTGDADGVRARIDTKLNGTKEAFVGKIEPDNDAPAVFYLQHAPAGDIPVPISIYTRNSTDVLKDTIEITVSKKSDIPVLPVLGIIILLGGGVFLWKRKRNTE